MFVHPESRLMKQKPEHPKKQPLTTRRGKTRSVAASFESPSRKALKTLTTGEKIGFPAAFDEVLHLIEVARHRAFQAANTELIDLYWNVDGYVSTKIAEQKWGKGTVEELSAYIQKRQPGIRGFSASNIWRMRQFFETYKDRPILAPVVRELADRGKSQRTAAFSRDSPPRNLAGRERSAEDMRPVARRRPCPIQPLRLCG